MENVDVTHESSLTAKWNSSGISDLAWRRLRQVKTFAQWRNKVAYNMQRNGGKAGVARKNKGPPEISGDPMNF
jgi:hypothetical protein